MPGTSNSTGLAVWVSLGVLVFGVAALGALLFPGVYRAAALVQVDAVGASQDAAEPVRLSRRLEEVTLDEEFLRHVTRARGEDAGSGAQAALTLRRAISFFSADGRTFEVSLTDSSPGRAKELCNLVAQRAVSHAPSLFRGELAQVPATARLLSASTRPGWPTPHQGWLLILGAVTAVVASSTAAAWSGRLASSRVHPALPLDDEPSFAKLESTLGLAARAGVAREQPAPRVVNPPPEWATTQPPRTQPMLPPANPVATATAPAAPDRSYTPLGISAQPVPLPLRRATLILGSPIAPTPIPAKPTPTSIFRPSPLPPLPERTSPSSHPPPVASNGSPSSIPPPVTARQSPSSRPPSAASSRPPSSHPLDRSGSRYSYVSTPVPPRVAANVELRDVSVEFDPALLTENHKPLRRQLFSLGVAQCFVTVVTSVGEAQREKARFAAELALCLAETGHARVLLVDADFGEPQVGGLLGVKLHDGESLARQLAARTDGPHRWSLLRFKDSLHALLQESRAQPELILGEPFRDCVIGLCGSYDFVVLNGPPTETGLTGQSFTGWVDGAVIVASDETSSGVAKAKAGFGLKQFLRIYTPGATVR